MFMPKKLRCIHFYKDAKWFKISIVMKPSHKYLKNGTVKSLPAREVSDLIDELKQEGFTGLVSVESVGLLLFVDGGHLLLLTYDEPFQDNVRIWIRPLSRSEVNLILSKGNISGNSIVYTNGKTVSIPLPTLGVDEKEIGISFLLEEKNKNFITVLMKWLQSAYPGFRVVERDLEDASVVFFSYKYLDRVAPLPQGVLKILVLDREEDVDVKGIEERGIFVLSYPYTSVKFRKILEDWSNRN